MTFLTILLIAIIIILVIGITFQWVYLQKLDSASHIISLSLVLITLGLAIVNYMTYQKIAESNAETINNYKTRNRPFVKIEPIHIAKQKNLINAAGMEPSTGFYPKFKLKNYGQFPAFIENIDIWIEDEPRDLLMPKASGNLNVENFALFQGEYVENKGWQYLLGNGDTEKIKKIKNENNQIYFVFKITYKILGDDKSLKNNPFVYWAKYKCDNPIDNQITAKYYFTILECGTNDIKPNN